MLRTRLEKQDFPKMQLLAWRWGLNEIVCTKTLAQALNCKHPAMCYVHVQLKSHSHLDATGLNQGVKGKPLGFGRRQKNKTAFLLTIFFIQVFTLFYPIYTSKDVKNRKLAKCQRGSFSKAVSGMSLQCLHVCFQQTIGVRKRAVRKMDLHS